MSEELDKQYRLYLDKVAEISDLKEQIKELKRDIKFYKKMSGKFIK